MKRLDQIITETNQLKDLILANPDLPIIIDCESELLNDDSYTSWIAPSVRFSIGEILDCEQDVNEERIYLDRIEFEEDFDEYYFNKHYEEAENISDEEWDLKVEEALKEYEPYWRKCILIFAGT